MSLEIDRKDHRSSWSAGAWFGSQIGSSLWMLILAGLLFGKDTLAASTVLGAFIGAQIWGLVLWSRRDRIEESSALQLFLAGFGQLVALVVIFVNGRHSTDELPYWTIALVPLLMIVLRLFRRGSSRRAA